MEAAVVGPIISATLKELLTNLISLSGEKISPIRNFKKNLEKLEESFEMIQAFLIDTEKKQVTDGAVRLWLKKLEAVAFEADDVLDELDYHVLRMKMETGNKLKKKAQTFSSKREIARKIRHVIKKLKLINQEATEFGLQRQFHAHASSSVWQSLAERETDSYVDDQIVVGRENYVSQIVQILTSSSPTHDEEEVFRVLPIVGMGGLGKTTTAKFISNNKMIEAHFQKIIWVYVSENFDAKDIFKRILESLTEQKVDLETKDVLLRKIQENLDDKKYLLILDDVWTEETKRWDDFRDALSSVTSTKGNGIIVTTRSENVASIVRTVRINELIKLRDEDCWSIIKRKTFPKGCDIPSEFEIIGIKIAERCQGLPLAANVVGGMLRGKSKEEWHSLEETCLSNLGEDGDSVRRILKLSFDNLPSESLKKCFVFFSIFPKGSEIKKEMLIHLWMAEGFLHSDQGNDTETVGEKYFDLLLQNSLLETSSLLDGSVYECEMHDLVHDLASSILDEAGPARYMYIKSVEDISKEKAGKVRSLIYEGKFSENMFSDFKRLRSLVLIGSDNKVLPKIEHLIHLRYLDIFYTGIEYLSKSIGNLYQLQTLRANSRLLKKLPETIKKLIKLRHFHLVARENWSKRMRGGIKEMPKLGHLPHLKTLHLQNLPNVRSIGSSLDGIHDMDKIIMFPALKNLKLSGMSSLIELLSVGETELVMFPSLEIMNLTECENLISAPSHLPCLKKLRIHTIGSSLFLENHLINLTSLTTLEVRCLPGLACLPHALFHNNQNLTHLMIECCSNLTYLSSSFGASLRIISIADCMNFEELPNDLHCLNSLQQLQLWDCPKLKSIPYNQGENGHDSIQGFTSLRRLLIHMCHGLTELPIGMIESCTSLEYVRLWGLPNVTNLATVVACLQKKPHLTRLCIDLRHTNNFPIALGSFRSLFYLIISCSMEIWEHMQDQLQHLTNLQSLKLSDMEIEALPESLGNLSFLQELLLYHCPKLTSLPSKEAMKRLTHLTIIDCQLLNLRKDDDNSEWHKVSHISHVHV